MNDDQQDGREDIDAMGDDEIQNIPKDELEANTTRRLLEHLEELEQHAINQFGTADPGDLWDEDEALSQQMDAIRSIIRNRLETPFAGFLDDTKESLSGMWDRVNGIEAAVERLQVHGHDGGAETDSLTYPPQVSEDE